MLKPTQDFDRFMARAKKIYAELERLPQLERIAVVNLLNEMLSYQCESEEDDREDEGEEWKSGEFKDHE